MKTAIDPRHRRREKLIRQLYTYSHRPDEVPPQIEPIIQQLEQIDPIITQIAPEWPLDKLNKVDLAILRLALWELINTDLPYKVVIDEAVELAKQYGAEKSAQFVNGALGTALKLLKRSDFVSEQPSEHEPD